MKRFKNLVNTPDDGREKDVMRVEELGSGLDIGNEAHAVGKLTPGAQGEDQEKAGEGQGEGRKVRAVKFQVKRHGWRFTIRLI